MATCTLWDPGWVNLLINPFLATLIFSIYIQCEHSMRIRDKALNVWVAILEDGTVQTGHCDCMAGASEACSHLAATLFLLSKAAEMKKSCTSLPCSWNRGSDRGSSLLPAIKIKEKQVSICIKRNHWLLLNDLYYSTTTWIWNKLRSKIRATRSRNTDNEKLFVMNALPWQQEYR